MSSAADPSLSPRRRSTAGGRVAWVAGAVSIVLGLLLLLATFDVGLFRGLAERRLSVRLGQRVTIARIERIDRFSLAPRLRLNGVRVAQPAWVGGGDMLVLDEAIVRVPVLPALLGRLRPSLLGLTGARLALVHDAGTRANWNPAPVPHADRTSPDLTTLVLRDVRFTLVDAKRMLRMAGTLASDARGVRMQARGTQRGRPAQAALAGGPVLGGTARAPWPFRATFASPLARLSLDATADRALDFTRFAGTVRADGDDLAHIDDLLLIGLMPTQPVRATARLTRAGDRWTLARSQATIGRSDVAGDIVAERRAGRWRVDAQVRSRAFGFDDLANAAGLARSAAANRRTGDRIVPDMRISLAKLRTIDGRVTFRAARLLSRTPSMYRSMAGTLVLDHARLVVAPLVFGLTHGRLAGRAVVTQPAGAGPPHLALDLALVGGRVEDIVTNGQIAGPLRGRLVLGGTGDTIRAAVARADGSVGIASRGGTIAKTAAEMMGRNLGAAFGLMIGGSDTATPLRCMAARFTARRGLLTPALLAIDTAVMRADGRGTVNLAGETLALTLDGRSKRAALVRLPAPIMLRGTLSHPLVAMRDGGDYRSAHTMLRALGTAVGHLFAPPPPRVPDADCGALVARAGA